MAVQVQALVTDEHLDEVAGRIARCHRFDDYPREASWVHSLGVALRDAKREVHLEAPYWAKYAAAKGWPRGDLWCPAGGCAPELFAEVKIAQRHAGKPNRLGSEPVGKILATWAADVWRLLVGPHRASDPAPIHCAFVVYAWGDAAPLAPRRGTLPTIDGATLDADALWAELHAAGLRPGPIQAFVDTAAQRLGATVATARPVPDHRGETVQAIIVEWIQTGRASATEVVD